MWQSVCVCVCAGRRGVAETKRQLVGSVTGETRRQTRNRCNFSRYLSLYPPLFLSLSLSLPLSLSLLAFLSMWHRDDMPETQCHRRARGAFGAQKASETTFETRLWSPDSVVGTSPGAARWQALVSSQGCLQWWVHCRDAQRPGGVDNWQHTGVGRVRFPLPKLPYSLTQLGNCRIPSLEAVCSSHCCHTLRPLPASIAIDIGKAILCAILPYCHGHQSTVHSPQSPSLSWSHISSSALSCSCTHHAHAHFSFSMARAQLQQQQQLQRWLPQLPQQQQLQHALAATSIILRISSCPYESPLLGYDARYYWPEWSCDILPHPDTSWHKGCTFINIIILNDLAHSHSLSLSLCPPHCLCLSFASSPAPSPSQFIFCRSAWSWFDFFSSFGVSPHSPSPPLSPCTLFTYACCLIAFVFLLFLLFLWLFLESFIQWRAHNTPALQVSRESGVQVIANWLIRLTAPPLGPHLANIGNCDPPLSCLQFSACGFRCSLFVIRCCNSFSSFFLFLSLPLCRFTVQCNATGSCKVAVCPPQRTG